MQNKIRMIKYTKIKRVLTVFLVSSLLFVSTACSQDSVAQAGGQTYTETAKRAMSNTYDKYDADQDFKGGMNGYNDDRRYDAESAAKAKGLLDTAKRRQADDLGEFSDNVLERSVLNEDLNEKATKAFSRKLENNKDKALEYVDNKSDKLQRNLEKVPGGVEDVFEGAVDTASNAVDDATKAAKKNGINLKNNIEDLGDDLS